MTDKILGFFESMGNSLDLFGVSADTPRLHRHEHTILGAFVRDADALSGDWRQVGGDIVSAWLAEIHGSQKGSSEKSASK